MAKGTFARMTDIVKSNINELLDRAEDPEKMIRQMIREMEEAVSKATASVGTAVANQKRLERHWNEKLSLAADWQRKAERAVEAGEDDLARRSLERKAVMQKASDDLAPAMEETKRTAAQLREQLRELRGKLEKPGIARERSWRDIKPPRRARNWPRVSPGWAPMPSPVSSASSRRWKAARRRPTPMRR